MTLVVAFVIAIPILENTLTSFKYEEQKAKTELLQYADFVSKEIADIKPDTKVFIFPRSIVYKNALIGEGKSILFSNINSPLPPYNGTDFIQIEETMYHFKPLVQNLLGANILITTKKISYSKVYMDLFIMLSFVFAGLFLISYFLMKNLIKPYEAANKQMDSFFKDVMHELKTPLGIMRLNLDGLMLKHIDKKLSRSLAALSTLSSVYDDLEYLIKNKTIKYSPECVDFSSFLDERCEYFAALADSKQITVLTEIEKEITALINRVELQRIVDNNITNALKYSRPQSDITVKLFKREEKIIFEIRDNGEGIQDKEAIFVRHYRGDIYKGGFGIGLSIVRSVCEKNGVLIEVESSLGKGSVFRYTFPNLC